MPFADPEKRRQMARIYNRRHRERNWEAVRRRTKVLDATRHANQRADAQGATGELTVEEVDELFAAHPSCAYCKRTDRLELDHVIALAVGGINRPENIVIACRWCNADKATAVHPTRWANAHLRCVDCGTTERKHICHGRCTSCYWGHQNAWRRTHNKVPPPWRIAQEAAAA